MTVMRQTGITAEEWLDVLLAADRDYRLKMAAHAVTVNESTQRGEHCWMGDHDNEIERMRRQVRDLDDALKNIRATLPEFSESARPGITAVLDRVGKIFGVVVY